MSEKVIRWIGGPKSPARYLTGWSEAGSPLWTFEVSKALKFSEESSRAMLREVYAADFSLAEVISYQDDPQECPKEGQK